MEVSVTKQYSIAQARDHLPGIVHEVERGSPVELTRRGKPVAVILSFDDYQRLEPRKRGFWESLQEIRQAPDFEGVDLEEEVGPLRDRSPGRDFKW
jgi:prevent-host-death family protein